VRHLFLAVATTVASAMVVGAGQAGAATVAPGQDHACIVGRPPASIDWSALTNPVLSFPGVGVKDQALQWSGGEWHMLYSDMTAIKAPPHVHFDGRHRG
jgi:hypothetical protein